MKYNDHYALGNYVADIYSIEKPWQRFWFLLGNVLPDINKITYLQGFANENCISKYFFEQNTS